MTFKLIHLGDNEYILSDGISEISCTLADLHQLSCLIGREREFTQEEIDKAVKQLNLNKIKEKK